MRSTVRQRSRTGGAVLAALGLLSAVIPGPGRAADQDVPEVGTLLLPAAVPADAWIEAIPLAEPDEPPRWLLPEASEGEDAGPEATEIGAVLPRGLLLLCLGAPSRAISCEPVLHDPAAAGRRRLGWRAGRSVEGTVFRGDLPLEGARVALVPKALPPGAIRPLTLPLSLEASGPRREVRTDGGGRYRIPPLAPGAYGLEIWLPEGRLDRSVEFEVSEVLEEPLVLPALVVGGGLGLVVLAREPDGTVLPGARVVVRVWGAAGPETWQALAGEDGRAELGGLAVGAPVEIECRENGHRPDRILAEQAPPFVDCVLEPRGALTGRVIGPGGQVPEGAVVSLVRPEGKGGATEELRSRVDDTGAFEVGDVGAGGWTLRIAAPGHEVRRESIQLSAGQRLDLGELALRAGREASLRVVESSSGDPIAGVLIEAVDPPGAVGGRTDGEGLLRLAVRSDDELLLRFRADRHVAPDLRVPPDRWNDDEPIRVEMEPAGWIAVTVLRGSADAPCRGCAVRIEPAGAELVTDGSGVALSDPLAPGWYRVVRPETFHRGSLVVDRPHAATRHVRVREGEVLHVEMRGEPPEILVSVEPPGPPRRLRVRSPGREEILVADEIGRFGVRRPEERPLQLFLLTARADLGIEEEVRIGVLPSRDGRDRVRFALPGTRLRAHVTRDGTAWRGAVELRAVGDGPVPGALGPSGSVGPGARTRTDGEGRLDLRNAPSGVWAVRIDGFDVRVISLRPGQTLDLGPIQLR